MPLRLNVGVSKKLGLPDYSSVGASCNLEVELDPRLAHATWTASSDQVRDAFVACHQAVNDELARLQAPPAIRRRTATRAPATTATRPGRPATVSPPPGPAAPAAGPASPPRPARSGRSSRSPAASTPTSTACSATEYGVTRPEDLSLADASQLIDQLKAAAEA